MEPLTDADPRAVGEFRLLARLGSGGMGQVFLATSPAGRMVAVKVIHPELGRDLNFVGRFRGEVAAARVVSGLYTAPVVAAGLDEIPLWLATAFVPGPSLDDIVTRSGPLPVPALWRLAAGLAEALLAIHSAGLVHRDLKPENVLLALDGPRVIDFGISRALTGPRLTGTGMIMGTPAYMSPEQVQGLAGGTAGDVFSLGSVLVFASAGVSPFSSPELSPASVFYRIVHAEPDLSAVPAEVYRLVAACLAKDPEQRPDLGQVAGAAAAEAGYLGLSPAAFWPSGVAQVIQAQQEAVTAQIDALLVTSPLRGASRPGSEADTASLPDRAAPLPQGPASLPDGAARLGSQTTRAPVLPSMPWQAASDRGGSGSFGRGTPEPGGARRRAAEGSFAPRGPAGLSRRGLLIGAGAAGVAVIGGLAGWKLASSPSAGHSGAAGGAAGAGHKAKAGPSPARTATGAAPAQPTLPQFSHLAPGQKAWSFATDGPVDGNPTVAGGVAYVESLEDKLYAVDVGTGLLAWSCPVTWGGAAPTVAAGILCAAGQGGEFSAIRATNGTLAWHVMAQGATSLSTRNWALNGASVIVPTGAGALQVYHAATGAPGMTYTTPRLFSGAVAIGGDIIYAVDLAGTVQAISASSGITQWHSSLLQNGPGGASLTFADDTLYLGAGEAGTLFSLNAGTGSVNWAYEVGESLLSAPVTASGVVYVISTSGLLQAITAANGTKLWTAQAGAGNAGPAVAGGQVYVCAGLEVLSLDASNGRQAWSFALPGTAFGGQTPAVADGLVFFGCQDKSLYAIRA